MRYIKLPQFSNTNQSSRRIILYHTHGDRVLHQYTQYAIDSLDPGAEIQQAGLSRH